MELKDLEIRALKPADRIYKKTDERGLYIEVRPGGAKLWRLKYRFAGKDKGIALGPYPEVSLAEARRKRDEARQKLRDGIDPLTERQREKLLAQFAAANTFGDIAREYIEKMVAEGRAVAMRRDNQGENSATMKMRRPHAVPLSRQVLAYLAELAALTGPHGYVLPAFPYFASANEREHDQPGIRANGLWGG
jgi:integrase